MSVNKRQIPLAIHCEEIVNIESSFGFATRLYFTNSLSNWLKLEKLVLKTALQCMISLGRSLTHFSGGFEQK
jgi:hypothetical protein